MDCSRCCGQAGRNIVARMEIKFRFLRSRDSVIPEIRIGLYAVSYRRKMLDFNCDEEKATSGAADANPSPPPSKIEWVQELFKRVRQPSLLKSELLTCGEATDI